MGKLTRIFLSVVVLIISYLYYNTYYPKLSPVWTIKNGMLQGIVSTSRGGKEYYSFLGIPYGTAERFEVPKPAEPWEGIKPATFYQSPCLQFEFFFLGIPIGSEQCLYLNVHTPNPGHKKNSKLLPTMAYFHGGYFHLGSSELAGADYVIDNDVILVTINYRLGALGFLNAGVKTARGNQGLKDQLLSLEWIQENIEQFGGDKSRVTIIGESAGGVSVANHVISPKSKGLFSRAIAQSGSSINYWGNYRNVKEQSTRFAKKFDCPVENPDAMVSCLKELDAKTLVSIGHEDLRDFFKPQISFFVPSIETINDNDAFLVESPFQILKSNRFNKVPVLTGCTSSEGLFITSLLETNQTKLNEANDDWETWAPRILHYSPDLKKVTSKLRKFYFGDDKTLINDTKYIQNFTNMIGDRLFIIGVSQSARLQMESVPTYLYYLDYEARHTLSNIFASTQGKFHFLVNFFGRILNGLFHRHVLGKEMPHLGCAHGDDIRLIFSGKWIESLLFSAHMDYEMSEDVVKLWTDFVKAKDMLKFRGVEWKAATK